MRLQSHIVVAGYIRHVESAGASAMLVRRGEASAGAIYIKVSQLDGTARLYSPAPFVGESQAGGRAWYCEFGDEAQGERDVDDFLTGQARVDEDIWVIEVEDREGRHFLGDQLTAL